jgi:RND superfamily putative drug exporter
MNPLAAIGRFSVRFRYLIVVVWIVGAGVAGAALPSLNSAAKANNQSFLPSNSPSLEAAKLATPFQPLNSMPVPVVASRSGTQLTAADEAAISHLQGALQGVSSVQSVRLVGVSPDGQAAELRVLANPQGGMNADKTLVDDLRSAIQAQPVPPGLSVHLAGQVAAGVDSQKASNSTGNRTELFSIIFILALLFLVFRSLLAPILTVLPAILVFSIAGPLIGEAAQAGLQVSLFTQVLLIVLVLGAGTDYGLFLVFRVREEIEGGLAPKDAVVKAVSRVGETISFSAATVIAALLSLLLATFGIYQSLGVPLAIGIALMLVAGLTLLPALLAIFGRAVFWPSRPKPGPHRFGLWGRVAGHAVERPALTLGIGVVVFGLLALAALGNKPSGFGNQTPPPSSDSAQGNAALAAHFPQAAANPTNLIFKYATSVWVEPAPLTTLQTQLGHATVFSSLNTPLDPNGTTLTPTQLTTLHATLGPAQALPAIAPPALGVPATTYNAYRAASQLISTDGMTVQIQASLTVGDPQSTTALKQTPAMRTAVTQAAHASGATTSGVAGIAPASYDISSVSSSDLRTIIPVAVAIIAVLLALVLRSLVAPLYLIASVVLSYLAALGLAVIIFIDLSGESGLIFFLPFLMFIFLLALGEDYNILVMTRIREEAQDLPLRHAITEALGATGTTVTSAGLVLAGTFAVLAASAGSGSSGTQLRAIGVGLALGILMDSFLVRTLLVPSAVALLGRWNWWPSSLSRPEREAELEAATQTAEHAPR